MGKRGGGVIYYRALDSLRQVFRIGKPIFPKYLVIGGVLFLPGMIWLLWPLYVSVLESAQSHMVADGDSPAAAFALSALVPGFILFAGLLMQLLKEISFAKDQEFLRVCPIPPRHYLRYRLFCAAIVNLPFCPAYCMLPFLFAWSFYNSVPRLFLLWFLVGAWFFWLWVISSWGAVVILCVANSRGLSRHWIFGTLYVIFVVAISGAVWVLFEPDWWKAITHHYGGLILSDALLIAASAFFVLTGYWAWQGMLRLWPMATRPAESRGLKRRFFVRRNQPFSLSQPWAVFQKDTKDLWRNPTYKHAFLGCFVLLTMALWFQWMRHTGPGTALWRRTTGSLTLMFLVPFFISGRAISCEYGVLDLYRLVLPKMGLLLDVKWKAQSVVNSLVAAVLVLLLFLGITPRGAFSEFACYEACVVIFVPLLTMLALALGTFFIQIAEAPDPFGMKKAGFAIYVLLVLPLYYTLMNSMHLGIALCSSFFIPTTLVLYVKARRSLGARLQSASIPERRRNA